MATGAASDKGILNRAREEIEKETGKTLEELHDEREKRVRDAVELREPDRVPVRLSLIHFPARYAGIPKAAAYYDAAAWRDAIIRTVLFLEPDLVRAGAKASGGLVLETLDSKQTKWPGGQLPPDVSHQAIDLETMGEDEYDLFLSDPTDFILRYYLPRAFGALAPLSKLPSLTDRFTGFPAMTPVFTREEFLKVARMLLKAGKEQAEWDQTIGRVQEELAALGFPPCDHPGGAGGPPFDFIVNNFRGYRGIVTDMYRRPEISSLLPVKR